MQRRWDDDEERWHQLRERAKEMVRQYPLYYNRSTLAEGLGVRKQDGLRVVDGLIGEGTIVGGGRRGEPVEPSRTE